ncbi:phosphate acyltransferase PlsX [Rurimicrobium arvi]|uniref:Phosphate acyltransferase n=1 Tax=Rurimicrobium arvi TaxID=2049916 RepID=A0ABP8MPA6_9BACT
MNIGLDVMGGDFAPLEAIKGVRRFFENHPDTAVHLTLVGDTEKVQPHLSLVDTWKDKYTFVHATQIIEMDEHPTKAFKEKPDSSIAVGFGLLARKKIDAFIGAGNTGAMLVGAMYSVKTIEGVLRPTIASFVPRENGSFNLLLDVGINADCKPEHLVQFAQLGTMYMERVMGMSRPRVSLLNIGEEEGKGNILAQATYPMLQQATHINFIGNTEGRDIFLDKADIFVCEGFVGNIILKMAESVYHIFKEQRGVQDDFLDQFNYELYGGTPILGINAAVMIGHGISSALAFENMIVNVERIVQTELISAMQQEFTS